MVIHLRLGDIYCMPVGVEQPPCLSLPIWAASQTVNQPCMNLNYAIRDLSPSENLGGSR